MKRLLTALTLVVGVAWAGTASAQVITMATNPQGSLAFNTGTAIAKVLQEETDLVARVQPMGGSSSYTPMIARSEVTFGFSNAQEFLEAYAGQAAFEGNPQKKLRFVAMVFPLRAGVAVAEKSGIKSLADLRNHKGLRITSGYTSLKTVETYLGNALKAAGTSYDDFQQVPVSDFVKGILALGEGKTDITWISLGSAAGRQVDAMLKDSGGWRYLDFGEEAARTFEEALPATNVVEEDNTKLPGIKEPTNIVQIRYMVATSEDTDEETVYKFVKATAQHHAKLVESFAPFRRLKVKEMAVQKGLPYHPGAIRAYKELGIPVVGE